MRCLSSFSAGGGRPHRSHEFSILFNRLRPLVAHVNCGPPPEGMDENLATILTLLADIAAILVIVGGIAVWQPLSADLCNVAPWWLTSHVAPFLGTCSTYWAFCLPMSAWAGASFLPPTPCSVGSFRTSTTTWPMCSRPNPRNRRRRPTREPATRTRKTQRTKLTWSEHTRLSSC